MDSDKLGWTQKESDGLGSWRRAGGAGPRRAVLSALSLSGATRAARRARGRVGQWVDRSGDHDRQLTREGVEMLAADLAFRQDGPTGRGIAAAGWGRSGRLRARTGSRAPRAGGSGPCARTRARKNARTHADAPACPVSAQGLRLGSARLAWQPAPRQRGPGRLPRGAPCPHVSAAFRPGRTTTVREQDSTRSVIKRAENEGFVRTKGPIILD